MSFTLNLPPSVVAQEAKLEEPNTDEPKKKSREDYKKIKELEEARKAGTVPAMKDESGKDINPHIPQYIMQAPWYFGSQVPTLRHQRMPDGFKKSFAGVDAEYKKGLKEGSVATKYRKGACENCGAMTHTKKDCLERPRKVGAKFTNDNIAPDEHIVTNPDFDFEGKRDRWVGYDPSNHNDKLYSEFAKLEEAKRQIKSQKMDEMLAGGEVNDLEKLKDDNDEDEKYADDVGVMPGQKFESKQRITVRNLRIREDTAKYLLNLDVNSAYYDPKTRSMRDNPLANTAKADTYTGDNFVRYSGDANDMAKQQMFAWEAYEKGADVHLQADPTKLEFLKREFNKRLDQQKAGVKDSLLDKYGGIEHIEHAPPRELLLAQTESYTEYSRAGTVIKGQEKATVRSRYEEDVYFNNHTSVWGSYWTKGSWGYKCCHSLIKESYCLGEAGKQAAIASTSTQPMAAIEGAAAAEGRIQASQTGQAEPSETSKNSRKKEKARKRRSQKKARRSSSSSSSSSESDSESSDAEAKKEKKVLEAMLKQEKAEKAVSELLRKDERKRPYNSMLEVAAPTDEEMEAWRRKQLRSDDPMASFMNS